MCFCGSLAILYGISAHPTSLSRGCSRPCLFLRLLSVVFGTIHVFVVERMPSFSSLLSLSLYTVGTELLRLRSIGLSPHIRKLHRVSSPSRKASVDSH